jgi:hypothetical protein
LGGEDNHIHPDRRYQVDNTNFNISDPDLEAIEPGPWEGVIASTKDFVAMSPKERKAFSKQKKVHQLSRRRSAKVLG